jgi:hypothetical protein
MATKATTESGVKTMNRFENKFWYETAFDAAQVTACLPALFKEAGVDVEKVTATFLGTVHNNDDALDADEDRAWITLTSPIGKMLARRMVNLGMTDKETMLYVLRVAVIFAEAVQHDVEMRRGV